jgi:hypothetical protein
MRLYFSHESKDGMGIGRVMSCGVLPVALVVLMLAPLQAHASVFTVTMSQQGSDVDVAGSGSFDLTGLFKQFSGGSSSADVRPTSAELGVGAGGFGPVDGYANDGSFGPGLVGPTNFGAGGTSTPSGGSGTSFLFLENSNLVLPQGYVSGTAFTDTSVYSNASYASMGITPGSYTWTWDTGANSLVLNVNSVPEPASVCLILVSGMALLGRRRSINFGRGDNPAANPG